MLLFAPERESGNPTAATRNPTGIFIVLFDVRGSECSYDDRFRKKKAFKHSYIKLRQKIYQQQVMQGQSNEYDRVYKPYDGVLNHTMECINHNINSH